MVRQWQEMFYSERYSFVNLKNPDFVAVSKGFGIASSKVTKRKDLDTALTTFLASKESYVLEIAVKQETRIFPMIPAGASVEEILLQ
jgi:acetolactate synthase-1/2/3 large subunit